MKHVLLDQNVPAGVRHLLAGHEVRLAHEMGWATLSDARLLDAIERAAIDVLVTCDQNLSYQQTIPGRPIGVVVLGSNRWTEVRSNADRIAAAVLAVTPGAVLPVPIPQIAPGRPSSRGR